MEGISTEAVQNWAPVILAGTAFLALAVAVLQLLRISRSARAERTYAYLRRYNDWEFAQRVAAATRHAERWGSLRGLTPTERDEVMFVVNFWEELAAHYMRRHLDRALVANQFGPLALHYKNRFDWFLTGVRERTGTDYFREWPVMNRDIEKRSEIDAIRNSLWTQPPLLPIQSKLDGREDP